MVIHLQKPGYSHSKTGNTTNCQIPRELVEAHMRTRVCLYLLEGLAISLAKKDLIPIYRKEGSRCEIWVAQELEPI